jgi:tetratricopeptide (TPR) repeat protein
MNSVKINWVLTLIIIMIGISSCSISDNLNHVRLREALNLESKGDFVNAERCYQSIPVLKEAMPSRLQLAVLIDMSEFYLEAKKYQKAINTCKRALKIANKVYGETDLLKLSILFIMALAYEGNNDLDNAMVIYKSIRLYADGSTSESLVRGLLPLIKLGDIAFKQGNMIQALQYYREAYATGLIPQPLFRVLCYRIAACNAALNRNIETEDYLRKSLPANPQEAGSVKLFEEYAKLLRKNNKFGSIGLLTDTLTEWDKQHRQYLSWLSKRVSPTSRFNLLNKYTEEDFSYVDLLSSKIKN